MDTRILVLEDDASLLKLFVTGLTYGGYAVVGVSNVDDLQRQLHKQRFDLLISDLHIGRTSGQLMLNILAQIQRQRRMPVLAISGDINRYGRECRELGLECLQKPFTNNTLVEKVTSLLEKQREEEKSG